ncbi:metal/formaldehyde-sensitive transcriptional repressor [Terriglobus sp. 2YAB30_2]|uniref:metal/formaldehyde-sensitive transcriptional repressor n=1 Tax=unclassified Terriglobus TaxID=2628988 RepID=UPI003F9D9265
MSTTDREALKLLNRVRRLRGQLDAVERALTNKEDCADVLMLLAAVRGGVNGLMAEVMEEHIRHHLAEAGEVQRPMSPELAEDLIDLLRSYLK